MQKKWATKFELSCDSSPRLGLNAYNIDFGKLYYIDSQTDKKDNKG